MHSELPWKLLIATKYLFLKIESFPISFATALRFLLILTHGAHKS